MYVRYRSYMYIANIGYCKRSNSYEYFYKTTKKYRNDIKTTALNMITFYIINQFNNIFIVNKSIKHIIKFFIDFFGSRCASLDIKKIVN